MLKAYRVMNSNDNLSIAAIVVAAGSGSRFGSDIPKQFCDLGGVPVVARAVNALRSAIDRLEVVVVVSAAEMERWRGIAIDHGLGDVAVAVGGANRWESVKNGLSLVGGHADVVLVHDGARPLVDAATVMRVVSGAVAGDGAIPAIAVTDSLRCLQADGSSEPVDRAAYRAVQTPQGFPAWKLRRAYSLPYSPLFTDDASVMAAAGFTDLRLVDGSVSNIKITHPLDLAVAGLYLSNRE